MNLKNLKPVHWLYNLMHYKSLRHNLAAYRKYNIRKPLIASISSKEFPDKESKAWLDLENSRIVAPLKPAFANFPDSIQSQILSWSEDGYLVLEKFFSEDTCARINEEIDVLMKKGKLKYNDTHKLMFANRKSAFIKSIAKDDQLKSILEFILDKEVVTFQTINFMKGSELRAHSDSVHMTTFPLGYMIAAWIALEDVTRENGPLFYYPGSHKMPYLLNKDFYKGESGLTLGKKNYKDYEALLEATIEASPFEQKEFYAKKGDVLIWHANLVHGGSPVLNENLTRKSMVIHYYAADVIKYHEITERPSLLEEE